MTTANQSQVVYVGKRVSYFGIQRRSAQIAFWKVTNTDVQWSSPHSKRVEIRAIESEFRLVDGVGRKYVLKLKHKVCRNMRDYIMCSKRVSGIINIGFIKIVTSIHRGLWRKRIINTEHRGIFADCVVDYPGNHVGVAVNRCPACRISIKDRFQC